MHVTALYGKARLPGIHKRAPHGGAGSGVKVGVIQHQHGIFAAEFEHHGQQPRGSGLRYPLACGYASSKNNFLDVAGKQRCSGSAITGDDMKKVRAESGFTQQALKLKRRIGSKFRWLENNSVAGGKSGERFHGGNAEWIIPWANNANHAVWLTQKRAALELHDRSEERRVGKECRS